MPRADDWGHAIRAEALGLGLNGVRGRLAYRVPVGPLLVGVYANPSGWSKGRSYLEAFVQPLYLPTEHLDFTIGRRLGGGTCTFALEEVASGGVDMADGGAFLDAHNDPAALLAAQWWKNRADIRMIEVEAYSLIWCGRRDEALAVLDLIGTLSMTYDWEHECADRATAIRRLEERSATDATDQLVEWCEESAVHLGLATTGS